MNLWSKSDVHSTTILAIKRGDEIAIGGDGQVTVANTVVKQKANKIRRLNDNKVVIGFAGATADAFALMEKFEVMLKKYNGNVLKSAIELAKEWRTDKMLRRLESLMVVISKECCLLLSGTGDVIEPDDGIIAIGSGGNYALAAARAMMKHSTLSVEEIIKESLEIASDICIYTNKEIHIEKL